MESPARTSRHRSHWSVRMTDSMLRRHPVSGMRWRYEDGFLLWAIEQVGLHTYRQAVVNYVDRFVAPDGSINTYCLSDYNLDQINPGRLLYPSTGQPARNDTGERSRLREQLRRQPPPRPEASAQADLPPPDVARRHIHGVSFLCPVRRRVRRAGRPR
jgi:unsaturated rhamnogalacturonyl hydrolase